MVASMVLFNEAVVKIQRIIKKFMRKSISKNGIHRLTRIAYERHFINPLMEIKNNLNEEFILPLNSLIDAMEEVARRNPLRPVYA